VELCWKLVPKTYHTGFVPSRLLSLLTLAVTSYPASAFNHCVARTSSESRSNLRATSNTLLSRVNTLIGCHFHIRLLHSIIALHERRVTLDLTYEPPLTGVVCCGCGVCFCVIIGYGAVAGFLPCACTNVGGRRERATFFCPVVVVFNDESSETDDVIRRKKDSFRRIYVA
jgi:hypothetical protein